MFDHEQRKHSNMINRLVWTSLHKCTSKQTHAYNIAYKYLLFISTNLIEPTCYEVYGCTDGVCLATLIGPHSCTALNHQGSLMLRVRPDY